MFLEQLLGGAAVTRPDDEEEEDDLPVEALAQIYAFPSPVDGPRMWGWVENDDFIPIPATLEVYGAYMESPRRIVQQDLVEHRGAFYQVSTVFLGINHNHLRRGPPILYETMVFRRGNNPRHLGAGCYQRRYAIRPQAQAGHLETLAELRADRLILWEDDGA